MNRQQVERSGSHVTVGAIAVHAGRCCGWTGHCLTRKEGGDAVARGTVEQCGRSMRNDGLVGRRTRELTMYIVRVIDKKTGEVVAKYAYDKWADAREAAANIRKVRIMQNKERVRVTISFER